MVLPQKENAQDEWRLIDAEDWDLLVRDAPSTGMTCPLTRHHIPDYFNFQQCCYMNLRSCKKATTWNGLGRMHVETLHFDTVCKLKSCSYWCHTKSYLILYWMMCCQMKWTMVAPSCNPDLSAPWVQNFRVQLEQWGNVVHKFSCEIQTVRCNGWCSCYTLNMFLVLILFWKLLVTSDVLVTTISFAPLPIHLP